MPEKRIEYGGLRVSRKQILIIEDEPSIAENISFGLKQDGFASVWETTGYEGLEALEGGQFCLVVLDIGLPDTTGFEVCKSIRRISQVPIIFLTARDEEIDRILGLEIGGDDYMSKPFSVRELVARIRVILRRTGGNSGQDAGVDAGAQSEAFGPFEVDEERYAIAASGTPLSLTRYEYRLLRLLIKRPGRVLTREQLMYHVWEEPEASGERTVDAHIKSLRSKLRDADSENDYIKTHRGIGYSIKY